MNEPATERRSFWRQPLLHFLLVGAAIFTIDALRGSPEPADSRRIVVTVAQVERLAGLWQKTWGRPPSEAELQALVRDHIKEEIYYREALKLGLDVNDTVIRRRLRQKMEFLTADSVAAPAPDDARLQAYYERNAARYRRSPVFDFMQVYLSDSDANRVTTTIDALREGKDPSQLGDPISLPRAMNGADEADIARTFGSAFYDALEELETGDWSGPLRSGFGRHIVRISRKTPAHVPPLDEVRSSVENDWRAEQNAASQEDVYEALRAGYEIEIEAPTQ